MYNETPGLVYLAVTFKMKNIIITSILIIFTTGCASSNVNKTSCPKEKLIEYYENKGVLNEQKTNRTYEEVSFIVGCNGKEIKNIHARCQKNNNIGWGKIIYEFTILPTGSVPRVIIVKSDFNNKEFENELKETLKHMKFSNKNVDKLIVTFPIEFRKKM